MSKTYTNNNNFQLSTYTTLEDYKKNNIFYTQIIKNSNRFSILIKLIIYKLIKEFKDLYVIIYFNNLILYKYILFRV